MNESLWILVGNTLFITLLASVGIWRQAVVYRDAIRAAELNSKAHLKMIKDLQDRIHASSLSDYMAIRNQEDVQPHESQSRSDEAEAAIEESRNGGRF